MPRISNDKYNNVVYSTYVFERAAEAIDVMHKHYAGNGNGFVRSYKFDFAAQFYSQVNVKKFKHCSNWVCALAKSSLYPLALSLSQFDFGDEYKKKMYDLSGVILSCLSNAFRMALEGSHTLSHKEVYDALTALDVMLYNANAKLNKVGVIQNGD